MKLSAVAAYFDKTVIKDGYTGATIGLGQLDLFDDSKRDAVGADRRILSTAAALNLPDHRCVQLRSKRYIVGDDHPDEFNGEVVRTKYIMQECSFLLDVGSASSFLANTARKAVHAGGVWVKDVKLETYSSDLRDMYAFYVAPGTPFYVDDFIKYSGEYYRVRSTYWTAGGFLACEANKLRSDTFGAAKFNKKAGTFDPVASKFSQGIPEDVTIFVMHWHDDYTVQNTTLDSWKSGYEPGDVRIRMLKTAVPDVGSEDVITKGQQSWKVISSYLASDGTWSIHGRPT